MPRSVSEWVGKTDDSTPPESVRTRLLAIYPACYICTRPFGNGEKVEIDHKVPLYQGGANRETNLRPVHKKCHTDKCREEAADRAKVNGMKLRQSGLQTNAKKPFASPPKPPRISTKQPLPPKQLYVRTGQ